MQNLRDGLRRGQRLLHPPIRFPYAVGGPFKVSRRH